MGAGNWSVLILFCHWIPAPRFAHLQPAACPYFVLPRVCKLHPALLVTLDKATRIVTRPSSLVPRYHCAALSPPPFSHAPTWPLEWKFRLAAKPLLACYSYPFWPSSQGLRLADLPRSMMPRPNDAKVCAVRDWTHKRDSRRHWSALASLCSSATRPVLDMGRAPSRNSSASLISVDPAVASHITNTENTENTRRSSNAGSSRLPSSRTNSSDNDKNNPRNNEHARKEILRGRANSLRRVKNSTEVLRQRTAKQEAEKSLDRMSNSREGRNFTVGSVGSGGFLYLKSVFPVESDARWLTNTRQTCSTESTTHGAETTAHATEPPTRVSICSLRNCSATTRHCRRRQLSRPEEFRVPTGAIYTLSNSQKILNKCAERSRKPCWTAPPRSIVFLLFYRGA